MLDFVWHFAFSFGLFGFFVTIIFKMSFSLNQGNYTESQYYLLITTKLFMKRWKESEILNNQS